MEEAEDFNEEAAGEAEELPPLKAFMDDIITELVQRSVKESVHSITGLLATHDVLEQMLDKTIQHVELKEEYEKKCTTHNQAELFNMLKYIIDFEIDDEIYEKLTFREHLIVSRALESESGGLELVPLGGLCVDVQKAEGEQPVERLMEEYEVKLMKFLDAEGVTDHTAGGSDTEPVSPSVTAEEEAEDELEVQNSYGYSKMVVHVSSQVDVDGRNGGSSVTSWVDRNLHTLEELRKEFIVQDDTVNEKSLYTALKKKWYYVKHTSSVEEIDDRKLYSLQKAKGYISEGANFILMRYLAISRYVGKFELACCYINGDLCRNIYECFGPESGKVENKRLDICRIRRTIIEECNDLKHTSITVLTLNGQIIKQEWYADNIVLHVNPKLNLSNDKVTECNELLLKDSWEMDMQLFSEFLDQKEICQMKNRSYNLDHPELHDIMADYLSSILMLRPPDIMTYTLKYFESFVSRPLPRNEYFD